MSETATVAAEEKTTVQPIPIAADGLDEDDETFTVTATITDVVTRGGQPESESQDSQPG